MEFPLISVIVVGYKRPKELEITVNTFLKRINYPRNKIEMILCDDCSPIEMQNQMKKLDFDNFLFSTKNEGIGKNTNKGIESAQGEYIIQLQDDWEFEGNPDLIKKSLEVFKEYPEVGLIKFRDVTNLSNIPNYTSSNMHFLIYNNIENGSKIAGDYPYSDNPHIKRKEFHDEIGLYKEKSLMHKTELDFCIRCAQQDKYKIAFIPGCDGFKHIGAGNSFNPSIRRSKMIATLEKIWLLKILIKLLRKLKRLDIK